jgi:predicted RNA-binding Zn-ribbon protein involved in translation (DUF1610 family)
VARKGHQKRQGKVSGPICRICANCKTSTAVNKIAFVRASSQGPGRWYCHRCILAMGKLRDSQSLCPKCGAITELRPLRKSSHNYYCSQCRTLVGKGKLSRSS